VIRLQEIDLVLQRHSLLHEFSDHCILPTRKWAASPPTRLNDIVRQPEQRSMLSLFVRN